MICAQDTRPNRHDAPSRHRHVTEPAPRLRVSRRTLPVSEILTRIPRLLQLSALGRKYDDVFLCGRSSFDKLRASGKQAVRAERVEARTAMATLSYLREWILSSGLHLAGYAGGRASRAALAGAIGGTIGDLALSVTRMVSAARRMPAVTARRRSRGGPHRRGGCGSLCRPLHPRCGVSSLWRSGSRGRSASRRAWPPESRRLAGRGCRA